MIPQSFGPSSLSRRTFLRGAGIMLGLPLLETPAAAQAPPKPFFDAHCVACHSGEVKKGGRDLTALKSDLANPDLRETVEKIPEVQLLAIDFKNAEITVEYVPSKVFPGAKPNQVIERFDNMVRSASSSTFGIKPLPEMPMEKLKRVEVPVEGLDCKACTLAAYEAAYKLEGVEQAFARFCDGKVAALIQPDKIDRAKLEDALTKRGVLVVKDAPKKQ